MRISLLLAMFATVATSAYAVEKPLGDFNYGSHVGVAEVNATGDGCLAIPTPDLQDNETIQLINLVPPQTTTETRILKKLPSSCSTHTQFPPNTSFYSFRAERGHTDPAIAIARCISDFKVIKGMVRVDMNGDGSLEAFRSCTSNEGLHLTIWAGEPLKTQRLWHEYYYLGYDVESACVKHDYEQ